MIYLLNEYSNQSIKFQAITLDNRMIFSPESKEDLFLISTDLSKEVVIFRYFNLPFKYVTNIPGKRNDPYYLNLDISETIDYLNFNELFPTPGKKLEDNVELSSTKFVVNDFVNKNKRVKEQNDMLSINGASRKEIKDDDE